jgi:hypothetical protein
MKGEEKMSTLRLTFVGKLYPDVKVVVEVDSGSWLGPVPEWEMIRFATHRARLAVNEKFDERFTRKGKEWV